MVQVVRGGLLHQEREILSIREELVETAVELPMVVEVVEVQQGLMVLGVRVVLVGQLVAVEAETEMVLLGQQEAQIRVEQEVMEMEAQEEALVAERGQMEEMQLLPRVAVGAVRVELLELQLLEEMGPMVQNGMPLMVQAVVRGEMEVGLTREQWVTTLERQVYMGEAVQGVEPHLMTGQTEEVGLRG